MKTLKEAIQDYLVLRRGLGFKLKKHSRFLEDFASFLDQAGASRITTVVDLRMRSVLEFGLLKTTRKLSSGSASLSAISLISICLTPSPG